MVSNIPSKVQACFILRRTIICNSILQWQGGYQDKNIGYHRPRNDQMVRYQLPLPRPRISQNQTFELFSVKAIGEFAEAAQKHDIITKTRFVGGQVSYLLLGKEKEEASIVSTCLMLLPVYQKIMTTLNIGAKWVQIDEPCLVLDLDEKAKQARRRMHYSLVQPRS